MHRGSNTAQNTGGENSHRDPLDVNNVQRMDAMVHFIMKIVLEPAYVVCTPSEVSRQTFVTTIQSNEAPCWSSGDF